MSGGTLEKLIKKSVGWLVYLAIKVLQKGRKSGPKIEQINYASIAYIDWGQDKRADFQRDKIADFGNGTKPPIPKMRQNHRFRK